MSKGVKFVVVFGLLLSVGLLWPSRGEAQSCTSAGTQIVDPEPFQWTYVDGAEPHYVGVLEYGQATFTIGSQTLTTRAYRQEGGEFSIPGPTITMEPGETYVLRFRNLLPYEEPSPAHNDFKDPNVTNLHTHGLHISGEGPSDDVTRMFPGSTGGDYVYDIPADHMGGSYWYHAHHHGSTFLQVSSGAFGMIIIDDSSDGIPTPVAAMEERQLLLGYLDPGVAGTGGDTLISGTLTAGWTVNGTRNATLCIAPNTWHHFRVLLADRDATPKDVTVGNGCEVKLLARDGVWRTTAPKDLAGGSINITGASRADLAVRCSSDSTISVGNTTVASIHLGGGANSAPSPYADGVSATWRATRPSYLRDLRSATNVNRETVRMGARTVNGSQFDLNTPTFRLSADRVQEWSLRGAAKHPFHLHVYHVQAMSGCGGDYEEGEYYDVIAGNCAIRFDLNAATSSVYSGRTIMHCHILAHEDQGAMGWLDVVGGTPPPIYPHAAYSESYDLAPTGDPTSVDAPTVSVRVVAASQGQKQGAATVTVTDDLGNPLAGAVVTGNFSGTFAEPGKTAVTDGSGVAAFTTTGTAKGKLNVTFCVTSVTHAALTDWTGQVCASS